MGLNKQAPNYLDVDNPLDKTELFGQNEISTYVFRIQKTYLTIYLMVWTIILYFVQSDKTCNVFFGLSSYGTKMPCVSEN